MASRATTLTDGELTYIYKFVKTGTRKVRQLPHTRILMQSYAEGGSGAIAGTLQVTPKMVRAVRKRYQQGGLDGALADKPRPGQPRTVTS